jgi:hypothetical protein
MTYNYNVITASVKRTLELAKFVKQEANLTTSIWYYNIKDEDKDALIPIKVKIDSIADDLVFAIQKFYETVSDMGRAAIKLNVSEPAQQLLNKLNAKFDKVVDDGQNKKDN